MTVQTRCPVIFDLDGTLVDSAPDIHASVNATLRDAGERTLTLDRVRSFIGGGVDMLWALIASDLGIDPAERSRLLASFMSRYYHATQLTRLFDERLGQTPMGFYRHLRLEQGRRLLRRSGLAVGEVARATGFVSAAHFSRAYRVRYGRAPSAERGA